MRESCVRKRDAADAHRAEVQAMARIARVARPLLGRQRKTGAGSKLPTHSGRGRTNNKECIYV